MSLQWHLKIVYTVIFASTSPSRVTPDTHQKFSIMQSSCTLNLPANPTSLGNASGGAPKKAWRTKREQAKGSEPANRSRLWNRGTTDQLIGQIVTTHLSLKTINRMKPCRILGALAFWYLSAEMQNVYINQNLAKETTKTCCGLPSGTPTSNRESIFETENHQKKAWFSS